ncbi:MAG: hypothetical protein KDD63_21725 [Bacteroidetes bacterium]|nr:hypothetical protein [Bacteroidota bacterium]
MTTLNLLWGKDSEWSGERSYHYQLTEQQLIFEKGIWEILSLTEDKLAVRYIDEIYQFIPIPAMKQSESEIFQFLVSKNWEEEISYSSGEHENESRNLAVFLNEKYTEHHPMGMHRFNILLKIQYDLSMGYLTHDEIFGWKLRTVTNAVILKLFDPFVTHLDNKALFPNYLIRVESPARFILIGNEKREFKAKKLA